MANESVPQWPRLDDHPAVELTDAHSAFMGFFGKKGCTLW